MPPYEAVHHKEMMESSPSDATSHPTPSQPPEHLHVGFYKGYVATVSRDVPWNALSFMFFAQSKKVYASVTGEAPSTDTNLALGALSGMTAAVIMTPVDVVKTRLMTGGATGGIPAVFSMIVREEGAATLMKGVVPRVAFLAPLSAITLSMYGAIGDKLLERRLALECS